jgi:hypothetical protein
MSTRMVRILPAFACMLLFVSVAAAHELRIMSPAKVGNGPELQPGTYKVEIAKNQDSAQVSFFQEGDLVALVPATLTKEGKTCNGT